jgi:choline dehydrogenase-like flavoprotein
VSVDFDPARQDWDVIIVGAGMGGGTLGLALAKAGWRALFLEQGRCDLSGGGALAGDFAESFFPHPGTPQVEHRGVLERAGRWTDEIEDRSSDCARRFIPFVGAGMGGSTALYGMALERFSRDDFAPRRRHPQADGAALPETWPIGYDALRPYYRQAEALFRVRGTADPLTADDDAPRFLPPPPLSPANQELHDFLAGKGLHPYRLPSACEFAPGCRGCQGFLCSRGCKNDAGRICVEPALRRHGAHLIDRCRVLRLEAEGDRVTGVVCQWHGQRVVLRGATVVLAAGALATPAILLRSRSREWPTGLANASDLVGRNLMRHCVDLYAVFTRARPRADDNVKEIAFNDLNGGNSEKLGSVQSFGRLPDASILVEALEEDLRRGRVPALAVLFRLAKPIVKHGLRRQLSRAVLLASVLEDLPYQENRVTVSESGDDAGIVVTYGIHRYERDRIAAMRDRLAKLLRPYRTMMMKQAKNNERLAHACGTCRFGRDPADSVLDPDNRAHGLANLYVVDASFFPSSAGTNPSLTIAANALRVAERLLSKERTAAPVNHSETVAARS